MSDLFDTSQVPDEKGYWDALAERVAVDSARNTQRGGFDWLARSRAGGIAASLLLAAALAIMTLRSRTPSDDNFSTDVTRALAPTDDVGKAIIWRDGPPAIGTLLLSGRPGGAR